MMKNFGFFVAILTLTCLPMTAVAGGVDAEMPSSLTAGTVSESLEEWSDDDVAVESPRRACSSCCRPWVWQILPDGLIYHSYLAGAKEPRFSSFWLDEKDLGGIWDVSLGGRVGILRYGTLGLRNPDGWQLDIEGGVMPRLDKDDDIDLESSDYRFGIPLTYGCGPWKWKFAYYHLSSHVGDEFLEDNPGFERINYSRDVLVLGLSHYCTQNLRLYGEAGYGYSTDGGSEPWEFQFGVDYAPGCPTGICGAPFAAINGHLREEVDFGGNVVAQAGWAWRGDYNSRLLRVGFQYYNGKSPQFQFFDESEEQTGFGLWYDY